MTRASILVASFLFAGNLAAQGLTVGSKKFTENVILGEIATLAATGSGVEARHRAELGGTQVLWGALTNGSIDIYPEYTGTIYQEIFSGRDIDSTSLPNALGEHGILMSQPLGFNNTYVLGISKSTAERTGITSISDLRDHPELRFGFTNEFLARGDGWEALRSAYGLQPRSVRGMDHDIAYRGLDEGSIDVIDLYSTDAEIAYYDIVTLEDDLHFFPRYEAVFLYRKDLEDRAPQFLTRLKDLEGALSETAMIELNAAAKIDRKSPVQLAASFWREKGIAIDTIQSESRWQRLLKNTGDHLVLVLVSLGLAILIALPLGIIAARNNVAGAFILAIVGGLYTIPALALLVFMIPLLGIGSVPAIVALFLYSLLPIVRNTYTGLTDISPALLESAQVMGLTPSTILRRIELPLASRSILAGVKTAAVINIGTATLGALIGAGGLGQPILTGIRLNDTALILEGAIPAALLAFVAQWIFDLSEKLFVPRGLRLE